MSKQFVKWIKSKVTNLIDPEREGRVKTLAGMLSRGLKEEQKGFRIAKFRVTHDHYPQELADAIGIVYRRPCPLARYLNSLSHLNEDIRKLNRI